MAGNKGCKRCTSMSEDDLKLEREATNAKHKQAIIEHKQAIIKHNQAFVDFGMSILKYLFLFFMMVCVVVHVLKHGLSPGSLSPAPVPAPPAAPPAPVAPLLEPQAPDIVEEEVHQIGNMPKEESDGSTMLQSYSTTDFGAMGEEETVKKVPKRMTGK